MRSLPYLFASAGIALLPATYAQTAQTTDATKWPQELIGTWSTKSGKTLTGPGFYDYKNDQFIEPSRTGISYSFDPNGNYEEAFYRAIANPVKPTCPSGMMQFQHGTWQKNANGSLTLQPIAIDGRQLMSTPCNSDHGVYTRYNQTELFKTYAVYTDTYHNILRLDLFKFDGSPVNAMYKVGTDVLMLPTTTLNPVNTATATATGKKRKRSTSWSAGPERLSGKAKSDLVQRAMDPDLWWWTGLACTGVGGLLYYGPRRLGIQR